MTGESIVLKRPVLRFTVPFFSTLAKDYTAFVELPLRTKYNLLQTRFTSSIRAFLLYSACRVAYHNIHENKSEEVGCRFFSNFLFLGQIFVSLMDTKAIFLIFHKILRTF